MPKLPVMAGVDSMKSTNNSETVGLKEEVKQGSNTGSNRINDYQNKLSSIK